jgi:hypothetical protein
MQKGHLLQFACPACQGPVEFSVFELDGIECQTACKECSKKYCFDDDVLKRQLKKFVTLCSHLADSEEILSNTAVGIDVGEHHVKVPFKLLLTRFNSCLELVIGDKPVSIYFRIEPLKDTPIKNR